MIELFQLKTTYTSISCMSVLLFYLKMHTSNVFFFLRPVYKSYSNILI